MAYFFVACSDAGETPVPDQAERFGFSSGGADHISGYGEWQIVLDREGLFGIVHKVGEDVRDLGGFPLSEAEAAEIWALVEDADLEALPELPNREGLPDEVQYTFVLDYGDGVQMRLVWANDARDNEALMQLVNGIGELIESYTGEQPVLR